MSTPPPDDPFAPSDATILRPRPGRRPATPAAGGAATPPSAAAASPPARDLPPQGAPRPPSAPESSSAAPGPGVAEFVSAGRNPILQAAIPLLVLAGRLHVVAGDEERELGPSGMVHFEPAERHEVTAIDDSRLVLFLAPWPGVGHPSRT